MNFFTRLLQITLDRFVIPLNVYIQRRSQEALPVRTVQQELDARIAAESAEYVLQNMPTAIQFARREDLWDYAWSKKNPRGFIAEFGVWNGYSINRLAAKETQIIYGFDSFAGLNEEWTAAAPKGEFDRRGVIPKVASNVRLIKGWFHESLPPFLSAHEGPFAFTHIDCDTYEATDVVLKSLDSRLQDGAIIVFDDYFGYRGWRHGEYQAFQDFVRQQNLRYEYLGYASNQVAVRISRSTNGERPCPRRGGTKKT